MKAFFHISFVIIIVVATAIGLAYMMNDTYTIELVNKTITDITNLTK